MFKIKLVLVALVGLVGLALTPLNGAYAIESIAKQVILLDANTGTILFEKNADELMPPSSMSKIMTVYRLFEQLKDGRLELTDTFKVSEKAWRKQGSKMFVAVNSRVSIEDLIKGIVVQSGNDASIVVAEGVSGSEGAFADELNDLAKRLGMKNSHFVNSSGWPDPEHLTTARDLAILAGATIENFPEYYHYYNQKVFTYNGIKQQNRNPTLYRNIGSDGLKTGQTSDAGFGLTASAIRKDRRLILVMNGLPSKKSRATESERLIDWGFRNFGNYTLFKKGETVVDAKIWMGEAGTVPLVIDQEMTLTLARHARKKMKVTVIYDQPSPAPIKQGQQLAVLKIEIPEHKPLEVPLKAGADVERLGMFLRFGAAIRFFLFGETG